MPLLRIFDGESIIDAVTRVGYPLDDIAKILQDNEGVIFNINGTKYLNDYDYAVVRYRWSEVGGVDLDTRTAIINTGTVLDGDNVGYSQGDYVGDSSDPYVQWGGDNQSGGVESALINLKKIKEDFPDVTTLDIRTRAHWYSFIMNGNGSITLEFQTYKGGVMSHVGFDFINTGGYSGDVTLQDYTITAILPDTTGQDLAVLSYDVASGSTLDNSYSISGKEIYYDETKKYVPDLTPVVKEAESNIETIVGTDSQSIFDIALMTYGSSEFLIKLLQDSNIDSINTRSVYGNSFNYDKNLISDQGVYNHVRKNGIVYGTY